MLTFNHCFPSPFLPPQWACLQFDKAGAFCSSKLDGVSTRLFKAKEYKLTCKLAVVNGSGIHTVENIAVACVKIILPQNPDQKIMTIYMKCNNVTR